LAEAARLTGRLSRQRRRRGKGRSIRSQHIISLNITALNDSHLPDAAGLFVSRYREARSRTPVLPVRHEDPGTILPRLSDLLKKGPGAAAIQDGRLVGFLAGMAIPNFKGTQRGVWCPEWAHAAVESGGANRADVYRRLYEWISAQWVAAGCFTQAITLFAHDVEAGDIWFRNGFGLLCVDAVRSLDPVAADRPLAPAATIRQATAGPLPAATIRRATPADVDQILNLTVQHYRYLAGAPIFLPYLRAVGREEIEGWLADPTQAVLVATVTGEIASAEGEVAAYLRGGLGCPEAAHVLSDPKTASITRAFTRESLRRQGLASALLGRFVEWARLRGMERIAVDFEPQNIHGSRFWGRHFEPVCHSVIRRVDERVVEAPTP